MRKFQTPTRPECGAIPTGLRNTNPATVTTGIRVDPDRKNPPETRMHTLTLRRERGIVRAADRVSKQFLEKGGQDASKGSAEAIKCYG